MKITIQSHTDHSLADANEACFTHHKEIIDFMRIMPNVQFSSEAQ